MIMLIPRERHEKNSVYEIRLLIQMLVRGIWLPDTYIRPSSQVKGFSARAVD